MKKVLVVVLMALSIGACRRPPIQIGTGQVCEKHHGKVVCHR